MAHSFSLSYSDDDLSGGPPLPRDYPFVCAEKGVDYYSYQNLQLTPEPMNYRLGKYLGNGTFGRCFAAYSLGSSSSDTKYCIKVLRRNKETHLPKLRRELFILKKLQGGPSVVRFYGILHDDDNDLWKDIPEDFKAIEDDDAKIIRQLSQSHVPRNRTAFVFERIRNTPWKKIIPTLSNSEISYYMIQLLISLDYSHSRGIMHRDVKPPNCMFDKENRRIVLIDWGQAEFWVPGVKHNVQVGGLCFKAPELVFGGNIHTSLHDYAVDIWSFGAMLANALFFDGTRDLFYAQNREAVIESISQYLGTRDLDRYLRRRPDIELSGTTLDLIQSSPLSERGDRFLYVTAANSERCKPDALDLINSCLQYNPRDRPTAKELILYHPYFEYARRMIQVEMREAVFKEITEADQDSPFFENVEIACLMKLRNFFMR